MRIVLASESQFRKRAMDLLGLPYETRPSRIDEKAIRDDDPAQLTRRPAEAKAHKIADECPAIIDSGDEHARPIVILSEVNGSRRRTIYAVEGSLPRVPHFSRVVCARSGGLPVLTSVEFAGSLREP
jgi:hypothetical protein